MPDHAQEAMMLRTRQTLPMLALVVPFVLMGCSASSSPDEPAPDPLASSLGPGAAADLSGSRCTADRHGVWSFQAVLRNPAEQAGTYTVTVSVVRSAGSTVVAQKRIVKELQAGAQLKLSEPRVAVTKDAKGLSCVVTTRARRP